MKLNNKAFTLVEILLVVIIIGILAGVGVLRIGSTKDIALVNSAASNVKTLNSIRNSLVGVSVDNAEELIRPGSNFQLTLENPNSENSRILFSYLIGSSGFATTMVNPPTGGDLTATTNNITDAFNASLIAPYNIFKSLFDVVDNNLLNGNHMFYRGEDRHTFIVFDSVNISEPIRLIYLGTTTAGWNPGTWIVTNVP